MTITSKPGDTFNESLLKLNPTIKNFDIQNDPTPLDHYDLCISDLWPTDFYEEEYSNEEVAFVTRFERLISISAEDYIIKIPGYEGAMIDFIDDFKMRTYITRLNASNLTSRELFAILTERDLKASSL